MKCAYCGFEFNRDEGKGACRGCPISGPCHMVKCPNCGYESPIPLEMKLMKSVWRRLFRHRTTAGIQ